MAPLSTWQDRCSELNNSTSVLVVFSAQDVYLHGRMSISEQQPAGIFLMPATEHQIGLHTVGQAPQADGHSGPKCLQSRKDEQS
jgi:hypothetical protein